MKRFISFMQDTAEGRFFIPFSIVLFLMSFFMYQGLDHTKNFKKVEATITKLVYVEENSQGDDVYEVYVNYTVDGTQYNEYYGEYPGYKEGQTLTIAYNPNNPKEIAQPISVVVPIGLGIAGVASLAFGIYSTIKNLKRREELIEREESWKHGS